MKKIKFIEINYHFHGEYSSPEAVIQKHRPSNLFAGELKEKAEVILVKHMNHQGEYIENGIRYPFFKRRNSFWQIPAATHRFIAGEKPDLLLVQGFIFPLQVMALRRAAGRNCILLLQHHGEVPFRKKRLFQRMADKSVTGYLFTAAGMASPWVRSGIIKDTGKCFEMPPASTTFSRKDKSLCREITGMQKGISFLWAGRLNANKDPLTVLRAFENYFQQVPDARLYMIFQENDLLEQVSNMIRASALLSGRVILAGKKSHSEMETWYNAADYLISASHHEGGSYVIMEAMACGCIPIVSNIPASLKFTGNGCTGYSFEKGNAESLLSVLSSLSPCELPERSQACSKYFHEELSPSAVADKMMALFTRLQPE
ncbi:MAG: glycosyltransferase family 4 protein [Chitinophagaceae bacterium]